MDAVNCEDAIYSDDYGDYIMEILDYPEWAGEVFAAECAQVINDRSVILHRRITGNPEVYLNAYGYNTMPKCYGIMDTSSMEASGVLALRRQPYLDLYGKDVLIGIVDTGIDYRHPAFIRGDGTSRIYAVWDQTNRTGPMPAGFQYGTEYRQEQLNEALRAENPLDIVPLEDTNGHGTFLAGIAAGNEMLEENFSGMAPLSEIIVVKLKEAKNSIKNYYGIGADKLAYQENDIMLGIRYLQTVASERSMPVVILIGLGTNAGNHNGQLPLSRQMRRSGVLPGMVMASSAGNEGGRGHHYQKGMLEGYGQDTVEINVASGESGLTLELWASAPQLFTVAIRTPLGNSTGELPIWYGRSTAPITFPLENSRVFVEYTVVEPYTGDEVIVIRILNPTPGIWRINVTNKNEYSAGFNMWLPIENFLQPETRFLMPQPDITLCEPANSLEVLVSTAYNHVDNSIYLEASRGYTSSGAIKPDIAAPGVNVYGPVPGGGFERKSGTSIGAAHCAGAAALLLEWGIVRGNNIGLQTTGVINLLVRGAERDVMEYPNRIWGYGKLNIYNSFQQLRPTR